jgi:beta-N-acetylglucosaminidase
MKKKNLSPRDRMLLEEIDIVKWKKIAGILKEADEDLATADIDDSSVETAPPQQMGGTEPGADHQTKLNGDDIHILNSSNAEVKETDVQGHPYNYLKLNVSQDLSEGDIDQLIKELGIFKERLNKMNTPQT